MLEFHQGFSMNALNYPKHLSFGHNHFFLVQSVFLQMDAGALSVRAYITHGVLTGEACKKVEKSVLEELVITDSIEFRCPSDLKKTRQVSVAPLFGEAIRRVTNEESVSSLFG